MTQPQTRPSRLGIGALIVALVGLVVLTFLPAPYVIQRPGPVYDTLGSVRSQGEDVALIQIEDAETYPTEGSLSLTTVEVVGNRERSPSWFELAMAWIDPSRAIVPMDQVFPEGVSTEDRNEQNALLMDESQNEARAAALRELGYEVPAEVEVLGLVDSSPATGLLEEGDLLLAVEGTPLTSTTNLRAQIQAHDGAPVQLTFLRGGAEHEVTVTPSQTTQNGVTSWVIGTYVTTHYTFPVDVAIQLDNVGGPSAGMMFALGIIDQLTPGYLGGGEEIAGTGTIDSEGVVGAIGGIRQKLYGARNAGAEYFLAPASNCDMVVGHVPDGLQVFAVQTLDDALAALDAIATGGDVQALATCSSAAP